MDKLKELLGLAPEASEEDVVAAVTALKEKADEADAAKQDAAAEAFANSHKDCGMDPLLNSMGKTPELKPTKSAGDARAEMAALPPAERAAYFKAHAEEIG